MPSVRFSRDKRGYEYVYLMHTPTRRGKPGKSQVLYWYRTPPGVRVGRKPFSEEVQRMLEAQHPGIAFDWPTIINTPMPPPDMTEFWREKRRAAKAAKEERRLQEAADAQEEAAEQAQRVAAVEPDADSGATEDDMDGDVAADGEAVSESAAANGEGEGGDEAAARKRRRRRGGRRRRSAAARQAAGAAAGDTGESSTEADASAGVETAESTAPDEPVIEPTEPVD